MDKIINVKWDGPFPISRARELNDTNSDYGLYQIYAQHPVYGRSLVYIGRARDRTFAQRIPEHSWDSGAENDPARVDVYVGRLTGDFTPPLDEWRKEIELAEKILIHAHAPAYNTNHIKDPPDERDCGHVRVLNWGAVASLHREVSGLMWTSAATRYKQLSIYRSDGVAR